MPSIDLRELDPQIQPADDFFHFVNRKWMENNPIPPEESRWGSFYVLRVEVERRLKIIFDELEAKRDDELSEAERKVRRFYKSGMDVDRLNAEKGAPLKKMFSLIDAIQNGDDLSRTLGYLHRHGVDAWWWPQAESDAKQSEIMALYFNQAGLSLPDRDMYLKDDEKSGEIRAKYIAYIDDMFARIAPEYREGAAAVVMGIEKKLAEASMTPVELRDVEKQYNKKSGAEVRALLSKISWIAYADAAGFSLPEYAIVCQPHFIETVNELLRTLELDNIKTYLRWHALNAFASYLDEETEKRAFDFYGRTFGGMTEMKPRWRRVLNITNHSLDDLVGELYVKRYFSEDAKKKVGALVEHLTAAYRARIANLDWMSAETKEKAFKKLEAIKKKLAYPDVWKDMSALLVDSPSYAENVRRARVFEFDRTMKKIGKPVDRSEWYMSPQTVNACYHPLFNEILFPAAILQPPFFDPDADDAVNYGGIGTVIGHELTHGFDDKGALFDAKGNLANWWTDDDKKKFDAKTEKLVLQYNQYEPLPGVHVNGELTLGENIADLGGLLIAYDGLMLALKEKPAAEIDGLTPEKRFFINYAITERGSTRDEALRLQVQVDPHSPSPYRVDGPFSNLDEFYKAFDVKQGNKLWRFPEDRVHIW